MIAHANSDDDSSSDQQTQSPRYIPLSYAFCKITRNPFSKKPTLYFSILNLTEVCCGGFDSDGQRILNVG